MSTGSLRPPVGASEIRRFLEALGKEFHGRATLFLVGGATLVCEGLRAETLDIDLAIEVEPAEHGRLIQAIRALKDRLQVNVEEANPADFIPLPSGARDRGEWIGEFGQIQVYHFDLYSTALSKIDRGTDKDLADVEALLGARRIEFSTLKRCYEEILPRFGLESLRQDPERLKRHFAVIESRVRGSGAVEGG